MARLMRLALLPVALLLLAGCEAPESESPAASAAATEPAIVAAEPEVDVLTSTDEMQTGAADFDRANHPGNRLYEENCLDCHAGTVAKAPHFSWLEMMSPAAIHSALTDGIMRSQAEHLAPEEILAITEYLTRQHLESETDLAPPAPPMCDTGQITAAGSVPKVNWGHDTSRFSPPEVAGLTASEAKQLTLKWSFVYPGAFRARSQPAVAFDTLFTGSQDGTVYAFDLETGCARWTFTASAEVRTGIVLADSQAEGQPPLAFFGDILARVYALNALTGELLWTLKADDHPSATLTGTPAWHENTLFVPVSSLEVIPAADPAYECCTFRGSLLSLRAADGAVNWRHYTIADEPVEVSRTSVGTRVLAPSGAPTWTSPTIDARRGLVYIGTGENYSSPADGNSDAILAIDLATGERAWTRQSTAGDAWNVACMMADNPNCPPEDGPDYDHGSSILLVSNSQGKDLLIAGHKNGTIFGLDPDQEGALVWQNRVGRGSIQGGVHFGLAAAEGRVYAPINDMNNTYNGDYLDPAKARPGVHGLNIDDGERLWSHLQEDVCLPEHKFCDPGVSAPVTAIPGGVIAGHLDGVIRLYDGKKGDVIWSYDSRPEHVGVNGLTGHGGSMSGAGAAVAGGYVVINSGYGLYNHEPGNLLLVFGLPDK